MRSCPLPPEIESSPDPPVMKSFPPEPVISRSWLSWLMRPMTAMRSLPAPPSMKDLLPQRHAAGVAVDADDQVRVAAEEDEVATLGAEDGGAGPPSVLTD